MCSMKTVHAAKAIISWFLDHCEFDNRRLTPAFCGGGLKSALADVSYQAWWSRRIIEAAQYIPMRGWVLDEDSYDLLCGEHDWPIEVREHG
jgi:hypothetical protein